MDYAQPFDQPFAPNAPYVNGDAANSIAGSIPPAAVFENPQREILAAIRGAGAWLNPSNSDLSQLLRSVRSGCLEYHIDGGSADSLSITCSPAVTFIPDGMKFVVGKGPTANATADPTLTVDGFTKYIRKSDGSKVAPGDLIGYGRFTVRSDGNVFRLEGGILRSDVPQID